jgi:hypothetical protein
MSDPLDNYASHWVYQIIFGVPEGMRHVSAVRLAGRWYSKGLTTIEVLSFLALWNTLNSPPLSEYEIKTIVKSTMKWEIALYTPPVKDEVVNRMVRSMKKQIENRGNSYDRAKTVSNMVRQGNGR